MISVVALLLLKHVLGLTSVPFTGTKTIIVGVVFYVIMVSGANDVIKLMRVRRELTHVACALSCIVFIDR